MGKKGQALIVVPLIVAMLTGALAALSRFIIGAFGIPVRFDLPPLIRAVGVGVFVFGIVFMSWLFKYRRPVEILVSTHETMRKVSKGKLRYEAQKRTEALILNGPQRHVRHPMYFSVVVILLGWWLFLDYTLLLLIAILFFLWFTVVVIRFEEHELRELFGEEYEAYSKAVPMIFPSLRPRWHRATKNKKEDFV